MLRIFLHGFLARVFRPRVTWRDVFAFMLGVAIPLAFWLVADEFTELAANPVWTELLAGFGLVILVRAVVAPYDMWRELIVQVREMHREIDDRSK
jgi:hypothetical protein